LRARRAGATIAIQVHADIPANTEGAAGGLARDAPGAGRVARER
jgi:hypothetical protein